MLRLLLPRKRPMVGLTVGLTTSQASASWFVRPTLRNASDIRSIYSSLKAHRRPHALAGRRLSPPTHASTQGRDRYSLSRSWLDDRAAYQDSSFRTNSDYGRPLPASLRPGSDLRFLDYPTHVYPSHHLSGHHSQKDLSNFRCSIMSMRGDLEETNKEISKVELCHLCEVLPRDLRKLDDRFQHQLPAILVRPKAILVNMGIVRALIRKDSLIIVEPFEKEGQSEMSRVLFELQNQLKQRQEVSLPFEFLALETLLCYTVSTMREDVEQWLPSIDKFLRHSLAINQVDKNTLASLLHYSKTIAMFQSKVGGVRQAVVDVLNSDEDLSSMYISSSAERSINDHDEAELLLENYLREIDEILSQLNRRDDDMQATEDIINISLDSQRNAILYMEVKLAMGTFALASGAFLCSMFGMNLHSGWEEHPEAFWAISGLSLSAAAALFMTLRRRI